MDFSKAYEVLANREPHEHDACNSTKDTKQTPSNVDDLPTQNEVDVGEKQSSNEECQEEDTIGSSTRDMSLSALTRRFFQLQEERVKVYADFQEGFEKHQATEQFPAFCNGITERFATLSNHINEIETILRERKATILAKLIRRVQNEEKEKLMMTSALFVEQMRLRDSKSQEEVDEKTIQLLEQSVETLSTKHEGIIAHINESLDELQAELVDLNPDDGE